jgi:hypothetical protein
MQAALEISMGFICLHAPTQLFVLVRHQTAAFGTRVRINLEFGYK